MKIEKIKVTKDDYFSPVTYVPEHAKGNAGHVDAEQGVLISVEGENKVRVLYCTGRRIKVTDPRFLVWG